MTPTPQPWFLPLENGCVTAIGGGDNKLAHGECSIRGGYFTSSHLSSCGRFADELFLGFLGSAQALRKAGWVWGRVLGLLPFLADEVQRVEVQALAVKNHFFCEAHFLLLSLPFPAFPTHSGPFYERFFRGQRVLGHS